MATYTRVNLQTGQTIDQTALGRMEDGIAAAAVATDVTTALGLKAPINNPTFTGIVSGITKAMIGLGNVSNTADSDKPASTAVQSALNAKAPIDSPALTGTPTINGVALTPAVAPPYTKTQLDNMFSAKAPIQSPTFTGTVGGITTTMLPDFSDKVNALIAATPPTTTDPTTGDPVTSTPSNLSYDTATGVISVKGTSTGGTTTPSGTPALMRVNNGFQVNNTAKRFTGANMYWLGLDDNAGTSTGSFPSKTQISNAMTGARQMGVTIARAHTIGMSAGTAKSYETAPGVFNDANLDAADYAVYQAKQAGIYLMVPLTDNWNYYHGGKWNFVHWAFQQNPTGIIDTPGTTKDDVNERIFFANTTAGLRVRALFKDYISHWMNHVNPYTQLAYKDDPTIAIIETGNEIYYASQLGTNEWTQDIASYVKSFAPNKLVADGSAADRVAVSAAPGLTANAVDIVGAHYYPQTQSGSYPPVNFGATGTGYPAGTALQQLTADVAAATNANKVFILGEYPWTRADQAAWYSAIEANQNIDADMFWSIIANTDNGTPLVHGGAFGGDDYPVHLPYSGTNETTYAPALATHMSKIA